MVSVGFRKTGQWARRLSLLAVIVSFLCPVGAGAVPGGQTIGETAQNRSLIILTADRLTPVTDRTGIRVSLPLDRLTYSKPTKYGTNWRARGNHMNVDSLDFSGRSLRELYSTLTSIRGRQVFSQSYIAANHFVIRGRDRDGNMIYVSVHQRGGVARGLSVVYSKSYLRGTAEQIIASFQPFQTPAGQTKPSAGGQTPAQPQSSAAGATAQGQAPTTLSEVERLKQEMARLKAKLEAQERARQQSAPAQQPSGPAR